MVNGQMPIDNSQKGEAGGHDSMKKAIIYIFTGTGNTRYAADKLAEALSRLAIDAVIWEARADKPEPPDPNGFDLAFFGYPTHAFNTPLAFLRFVKALPDASGLPAYIFKTAGEPLPLNSASSRALVQLLRKKGFDPMLDRQLLMPYNILFRYKDALAKQMALHTGDMADLIAHKAAGGQREVLRYGPLVVLVQYLLRFEWAGAVINGFFFRVKKERCTGCGLCAAKCPVGNIRMHGEYPRFSGHCTMCMGCAYFCPSDAVRPGFVSPLRVNGPYPYKKLIEDDTVPGVFVNEDTKGYFRSFRAYYEKTYEELRALKNAAPE